MKKCTKCEEFKPVNDFYRHRFNKDGREGLCKRCKAIYRRKYFAKHRGRYTQKRKERYNSDLNFRLAQVLRTRISNAMKSGSAVQNLGCTLQELRLHLELLWEPGMDWKNYGLYGWHIDHIKPLNSFDLTDPEQLKEACHFSNLRPLWASDNIAKGGI